MSRVVEPLRQMGARIAGSAGGRPPLVIEPVAALTPIRYRLPMPSAQVKSAVLLAGLYAPGATVVIEPVTTRDHTERMLMRFGCAVVRRGDEIRLDGGQQPRGTHVDVPADLSSAAFFVVGASIASDSVLELEGVGVNPTRTGVLDILRAMGADIVLRNRRQQGGEPVADVVVRSARLRGARIGGRQVALAIDELPVLAVAAACADGVTVVRDAAELRHKESDRIAAVVEGLRALGIDADEHDDGMTIHGGRPRGGVVDSCGDHRLAMAFAMAALAARDEVRVRHCRNVATSFPDFDSLAKAAGLGVTREVGR